MPSQKRFTEIKKYISGPDSLNKDVVVMTKKTYTLTQLVASVKNVLARTYGEQSYWVTGELVKLNMKGGHYYL